MTCARTRGPSPDAQTLARAAEPIDDTLLQAEPDWLMDIACCCPSRPAVRVVVPASGDRPRPAELLLCGHHFRVSQRGTDQVPGLGLRPLRLPDQFGSPSQLSVLCASASWDSSSMVFFGPVNQFFTETCQ